MAKCDDWTKLHEHWHAGDVVWASGFKETTTKTGHRLRAKPQRGMLATARDESTHAFNTVNRPGASLKYFVPLTRTGKPSWSRVVWVGSRTYADTEREALELYNSAIQREIERHRERIRALVKELVPTLDRTKNPDSDACEVEPVYRADFSLSADDVLAAMDMALVPSDGFEADVMEWDAFVALVENGDLNDHDGIADLMVDGRVSQCTWLYLYDRRLIIDDLYLVPFERIPEIFAGHDVKVAWFNK